MGALDSKEKLKELYLPSVDDFVFVDVPELRYLMLDGQGSLEGERGLHVTRWLFAVVHPIKAIAKERMGKNFVEPPLECLWWADDMCDFIAGRKEKLKWRMMIVTADWMEEDLFEQGIQQASKKLGEIPTGLRWKTTRKADVCRSCTSVPAARSRQPLPDCTTSFCRPTT